MSENEDREICLCFSVYENKIRKFCRLNNPKFASLISECFGAGTGCGTCIPELERIFKEENEKRKKETQTVHSNLQKITSCRNQ